MLSRTVVINHTLTKANISKRFNALVLQNLGFHSLKNTENGFELSFKEYIHTGIPIVISIDVLDENKCKIKMKVDSLITILFITSLIIHPVFYLLCLLFKVNLDVFVYMIPVFYILSIVLYSGFIYSSFSSAYYYLRRVLL